MTISIGSDQFKNIVEIWDSGPNTLHVVTASYRTIRVSALGNIRSGTAPNYFAHYEEHAIGADCLVECGKPICERSWVEIFDRFGSLTCQRASRSARDLHRMGTGRQQMLWRVMADIVVAVHATYVAIVVVGLAAILIGSAAQWRWVRNFCFRAAHLAMILLVCAEALVGTTCPLTRLVFIVGAAAPLVTLEAKGEE